MSYMRLIPIGCQGILHPFITIMAEHAAAAMAGPVTAEVLSKISGRLLQKLLAHKLILQHSPRKLWRLLQQLLSSYHSSMFCIEQRKCQAWGEHHVGTRVVYH